MYVERQCTVTVISRLLITCYMPMTNVWLFVIAYLAVCFMLQVFPPLQLDPHNITVIPGTLFQVCFVVMDLILYLFSRYLLSKRLKFHLVRGITYCNICLGLAD